MSSLTFANLEEVEKKIAVEVLGEPTLRRIALVLVDAPGEPYLRVLRQALNNRRLIPSIIMQARDEAQRKDIDFRKFLKVFISIFDIPRIRSTFAMSAALFAIGGYEYIAEDKVKLDLRIGYSIVTDGAYRIITLLPATLLGFKCLGGGCREALYYEFIREATIAACQYRYPGIDIDPKVLDLALQAASQLSPVLGSYRGLWLFYYYQIRDLLVGERVEEGLPIGGILRKLVEERLLLEDKPEVLDAIWQYVKKKGRVVEKDFTYDYTEHAIPIAESIIANILKAAERALGREAIREIAKSIRVSM